MKQIPVWLDCDPGVDDAAAFLLAHSLPEVKIAGVGTVAGNAPLEKTTKNALRLRDLMGEDFPVYPGAEGPLRRPYHDGAAFHGADGLGGAYLPGPSGQPEKTAAWDGLYEAAEKYGKELTVLTMGPLTNMALAFGKYPDLPEKIGKVIMMAGSITRGNRTPCAEYNVYADPEAAQSVFRSGADLVMCGLEVTEQAYLTREELEKIGNLHTPKGNFFCSASGHILEKNLAAGHRGFCVHDAVTVFYAARPECFSGERAGVFVETQGELTLGKTVCDLNSDRKFDVKNVFLPLEIDREAFRDALTEAMKE